MGMFRKVVAAGTCAGALERTIEKVLAEIDQRAAQGLDEFTVSFTEKDIGIMNRADVVTPMIVGAVQDAGHAVVGISDPYGNYTISMRVRPAARRPAALATSAAVEAVTTYPLGSLSPEEAAFQELHRWVGRDQIGVPFGAGHGLEQAVAATRLHLRDRNELSLSSGGWMSIAASDIRDKTVTFADWDTVLGYDPEKLGERDWARFMEAAMVYKRAVAEHAKEAGPLYEQWKRDDRFAAELYSFIRVTYGRLIAAGIVAPWE